MAYKEFANGYQLFASDLNNYLMKQSVMVFATATARDAALTSPTEGMLTWLEDSNKYTFYSGAAWTDLPVDGISKSVLTTAGDLIVATGASTPSRLAIGTSGKVLTSNGTTATWEDPVIGSLTLLSTTSLSGTSVLVNSISQAYNDLVVVVRGWTYNANACLNIFPNEMNGNVSGVWNSTAYSDTLLDSWGAQTAAGNSAYSAVLVIKNYTTSYEKPLHWFGRGGMQFNTGGSLQTTSAVNRIKVGTQAGSSTFTGGQVLIYGVK